LPLLENPAFAFPHCPGFEPRRVGSQLAHPALGQAEITREPHRRAGIAANDANLNFKARRQLAALDKGGVHYLISCESTTPSLLTSHLVSLFLAPYRSADRISDSGGVEGEHEGITVVERLLAELAADVDQGRISDGKLLTLVLALRLRRPDLFV
jgi:hypothetical protein